MPEIPVEQVGESGEGLDVEVPPDGSKLSNPDEPVEIYNPELDATTQVPRFALESLWAQRGWVEYDPSDPDSLAALKAGAVGQDGAPPEGDSVPPDDVTSADSSAKGGKDGTTASGAAPAAKTKE